MSTTLKTTDVPKRVEARPQLIEQPLAEFPGKKDELGSDLKAFHGGVRKNTVLKARKNPLSKLAGWILLGSGYVRDKIFAYFRQKVEPQQRTENKKTYIPKTVLAQSKDQTVAGRYTTQNNVLSQFENKSYEKDPEWKNFHALGVRLNKLQEISDKIQKSSFNKDTYLEYLSHEIAYQNLQQGMLVPGRTPNSFYEVDRVFVNPEGLIAYGLKAVGDNNPDLPILLFQGTDPQNIKQLHLDTDLDIGQKAVFASQKELEDWLKDNPNTTLTGHSLGGAKAQQLANCTRQSIQAVVTFGAPGVSDFTARQFQKKQVDNQRNNQTKIEVRHYVTEGDKVPNFGETPLPGVLYTIPSKLGFFGSIEAHTVNALLEKDEKKSKEELKLSSAYRKERTQAEQTRLQNIIKTKNKLKTLFKEPAPSTPQKTSSPEEDLLKQRSNNSNG